MFMFILFFMVSSLLKSIRIAKSSAKATVLKFFIVVNLLRSPAYTKFHNNGPTRELCETPMWTLLSNFLFMLLIIISLSFR